MPEPWKYLIENYQNNEERLKKSMEQDIKTVNVYSQDSNIFLSPPWAVIQDGPDEVHKYSDGNIVGVFEKLLNLCPHAKMNFYLSLDVDNVPVAVAQEVETVVRNFLSDDLHGIKQLRDEWDKTQPNWLLLNIKTEEELKWKPIVIHPHLTVRRNNAFEGFEPENVDIDGSLDLSHGVYIEPS